MINIGFGPTIFLGLIFVFGVILLYFFQVVKPEITRDEDTTISLLYNLYFNNSWMTIISYSII